MTTGATPQVYGVKEALAELRQVDAKLYREAMKDIRMAMNPLTAEVQSRIPDGPPLSGWARGQGRWEWSKKGTRVSAKAGGRRPKTREVWPLARVVLSGASAAIYDMAGKATTNRLASSLNRAGWPAPSRSAWPGAEARLPEVQRAVLRSVEATMRQVNAKMVTR
jgi:hypothetical protein